jgi:hypothetical protein
LRIESARTACRPRMDRTLRKNPTPPAPNPEAIAPTAGRQFWS